MRPEWRMAGSAGSSAGGGPRRWSGALTLLLVSGAVPAAQWDITPRLHVEESYSDNVTLAPDNELDDFVTEMTPGISVRGTGARLLLNLDYNYQMLRYASNPTFNGNNHQLQSNATAEILEDIFFLEARGRVSQQLINPRGKVSESNASVTGNRTDALVYGFSPYLRHHFGAYADTELRYDRDEITHSGGRAADSTIRHLSGFIENGRRFEKLPWKLTLDRSKTEHSTGLNVELNSVAAELGYAFNRQYRLSLGVGRDNNEFASGRRSIDGSFWALEGTWTPSVRTSLTASFGERFFGRTYRMQALHRHRRWLFTADYTEQAQTTAQLQARQQLIPLTDASGQPVFDPVTSSRIPLETDTPELTDEVFVNKRLNVGFIYAAPRNTVNVKGYQSNREFQVRNQDQTARGVSATWTHLLSPRLRGGLNGSFQTIETDGAGDERKRYLLRPFVTYQLGRSVSTTVEYRYHANKTEAGTDDYTENQVTAFVNVHL